MKKYEQNNKTTDRILQRKNTAPMRCVFSFWYVIERFLLLCSAIYKAWGMLLPKEKSIYELEFVRRSFLGKMILRRSCNSNLFIIQNKKGSFPVGKPPLVCTHII